ncbi:hypothetical protein L9F63_001567, partial [Diploptera punctata]
VTLNYSWQLRLLPHANCLYLKMFVISRVLYRSSSAYVSFRLLLEYLLWIYILVTVKTSTANTAEKESFVWKLVEDFRAVETTSGMKLLVIANCLLLLTANLLGLTSYYLADKQQRRAFLETRQSLEMKLVIEEQSAEQKYHFLGM